MGSRGEMQTLLILSKYILFSNKLSFTPCLFSQLHRSSSKTICMRNPWCRWILPPCGALSDNFHGDFLICESCLFSGSGYPSWPLVYQFGSQLSSAPSLQFQHILLLMPDGARISNSWSTTNLAWPCHFFLKPLIFSPFDNMYLYTCEVHMLWQSLSKVELERILLSTSCICELKKSIAFSQKIVTFIISRNKDIFISTGNNPADIEAIQS